LYKIIFSMIKISFLLDSQIGPAPH
jgi:hypothetical protein